MEPTFKPIHAAGVLVLLAVASFRGESEANRVVADCAIGLIGVIVGMQAYYAWINYCSVRNLEALDDSERRYYMSFVQHPTQRAVIERQLAPLASPESGPTEVFHPSPALRRFLEWPLWIGVAAASLPLVGQLFGLRPGIGVWGLAGFGVLSASYAWVRLRTLRHSIEITPFGIAEVHPDGGRRALRWTGLAAVRPFPRRRIVRLYPAAGPGSLSFSYDMTGITRLLEAIVEYGELNQGRPPTE